MEKFPEQSQINRLLHNFSGQLYQVDHLFETLLMTFGLCRDQAKVNFDFDCTGKDYFNLFAHFTSESMMASEVFRYYNGRQNIEALIKGEKHSLHIIAMKTRSFAANYAFLYFAVIVFNLLAWFKHRVLKGTNLEHLGLHDLTTKLMHIPAQIQFNDEQLELALPSQHPMIRELSQPPRADQTGAGDQYF
jgi:hypothetical protein